MRSNTGTGVSAAPEEIDIIAPPGLVETARQVMEAGFNARDDHHLMATANQAMADVRMTGADLDRLRSFVVLSEELHFTRAATRLHLTQPTLSQQIQALERQLGADLVRRDA